MPELPEVETTLRGISPVILQQKIVRTTVRNPRLHWPIPSNIGALLQDGIVSSMRRRGKYLLIGVSPPIQDANKPHGTLIIHLGMSGSLTLSPCGTPHGKHDHFDIDFGNGQTMRLRDPRRFGSVLWHQGDPMDHFLLKNLGLEPLSADFTGEFLFLATRGKSSPIKMLLMDSHHVVGIGNIYANESLFMAGVRPTLAARRLSRKRCDTLASCVRDVLLESIEKGGSSLRDFVGSHGESGHFQEHCRVYGRGGEGCPVCGSIVRRVLLGGRSSFYCPSCQKAA